MFHSFFLFSAIVGLLIQGYIVFYALFFPFVVYKIYGVPIQMVQAWASQSIWVLKVLPVLFAVPLFVVLIFAFFWMIQKKNEGRFIWAFVSLIWLIVGLSAVIHEGMLTNLVYLEGIRGLLVFVAAIFYATLGQRKKYLFHVKR